VGWRGALATGETVVEVGEGDDFALSVDFVSSGTFLFDFLPLDGGFTFNLMVILLEAAEESHSTALLSNKSPLISDLLSLMMSTVDDEEQRFEDGSM
jgi:hypothetical protein